MIRSFAPISQPEGTLKWTKQADCPSINGMDTRYLPPETRLELKREAPLAEKIGRLTNTQLKILYARKLFNLFVPQSLGGLELDLIEGLRIEEEIAGKPKGDTAYPDAGITLPACPTPPF